MSSDSITFLSAGQSDYGELCREGDGFVPSLVTGLDTKNLVQVSIGISHCAAVYSDGTVYGWGHNFGGRIGIPLDGDNAENEIIRTPTLIKGLPKIAKVKCGNDYTLFLSKDNEVFLATYSIYQKELFKKIELSGKCVSIFGNTYPWIVCEDGSLYGIPRVDYPDEIFKFELPPSAKSEKIKNIINFRYNYCFGDLCLTESGHVFGRYKVARDSENFVEIESLKDQKIIKISGFHSHVAALAEDGSVFFWGMNYHGELGTGSQRDQLGPFIKIRKFTGDKIVDVCASNSYSVFVDEKGNVWAVGRGSDYGQTLFGDRYERIDTERVTSIDGAVAVSCGYHFTYIQIGGTPILE